MQQQGLNKNINGLLRKYVYKETDCLFTYKNNWTAERYWMEFEYAPEKTLGFHSTIEEKRLQ